MIDAKADLHNAASPAVTALAAQFARDAFTDLFVDTIPEPIATFESK